MTTVEDSVNLTPKQEACLNFLIGQVMKATKGKANPQLTRTLLLERLNGE